MPFWRTRALRLPKARSTSGNTLYRTYSQFHTLPNALAQHLKRLLENRSEARVTIQEKGDIRSAEYQIRSAGEISAKPT